VGKADIFRSKNSGSRRRRCASDHIPGCQRAPSQMAGRWRRVFTTLIAVGL